MWQAGETGTQHVVSNHAWEKKISFNVRGSRLKVGTGVKPMSSARKIYSGLAERNS
jgi:hypothetical protein